MKHRSITGTILYTSKKPERLDERRGILHIRRHLAATPLFKGIADFKSTRIAMLRAETIDELFGILNNIPEQFNIGAEKIDLHQI